VPAATDYWIIPLDGAYAVRSAAGIELEGIATPGDAQDHILDLTARDLIAAQEERAALDDYEAQILAEAA
jgi:hypothetical protein